MWAHAWKLEAIRSRGSGPTPDAFTPSIVKTGLPIPTLATRLCSEKERQIGKESFRQPRALAESSTISSNRKEAATRNWKPHAAASKPSEPPMEGSKINSMRLMFLAVLACCSLGVLAQDSSKTPSDSSPKAGDSSSSPQRARKEPNPNLAPPRSDRVSADSLEPGESSSKDTQIDLSPPPDDAKAHPDSSSILVDEGSGDTDPNAFRYWDPH